MSPAWIARRTLVVLTTASALAIAALAPSIAGGAGFATIQAVLSDDDGSGLMIVNSQTNPAGETWAWETCAPDLSSCAPFGTGRQMRTNGAPAEVVFRATSSNGAVGTSPVWHGTPEPLTPPSVSGEVRANELVVPVRGTWRGGWEGDVHLTQLAACATPEGTNCITLTDDHYVSDCPGDGAVIERAFEGDYLRVADRDLGANPVFEEYAANSPYSSERLWLTGPTISTAIVGRIAPADGPRASDCGPPPMPFAKLYKGAFAYVKCLRVCRAKLVARRGRRVERETSTVPQLELTRLRLRGDARERLGGRRARITVKVDGRRIASRSVGLRADGSEPPTAPFIRSTESAATPTSARR